MTDAQMEPEVLPPLKKKRFGNTFYTVAGGVIVGLLANYFIIDTYVVPSTSMENTLQVQDYLVSVPLLDNQELPSQGAVIVFNPPTSWGQPEGTVYVKRVIGVSGDTVEWSAGESKLQVNGKAVDEPYVKNGEAGDREFSYTVPEGNVFVMGDNRLNSADSRYHPDSPFVPVDRILGQPKILIWPLTRIGAIS